MLLGGLIAFVVLSLFYGVWMVRRMSRHWPGAKQLSGSERARVADAARGGRPIYDPRLAQDVVDYRNGLHAAAEDARPFRWLLPIVLVVGIAIGSVGRGVRYVGQRHRVGYLPGDASCRTVLVAEEAAATAR